MKVNAYTKLLKLVKYAPVVVLAVSLLLNGGEIGTTGDKLPPGKDPSVF